MWARVCPGGRALMKRIILNEMCRDGHVCVHVCVSGGGECIDVSGGE